MNRGEEDTHTLSVVRDACNGFGLELLRAVVRKEAAENNVLISPFSIATVLTMAACGANNEGDNNVSEEMRQVLQQAQASEEEVKAYFKKMLSDVLQGDEGVQVLLANSAWTKQSPRGSELVSTDYKEIITRTFKAESRALTSTKAINDWCSEKTHGVIPHLIDSLPSATLFVLMSAIYFKGEWKMQFKPENTRKDQFTHSSGRTTSVDMMSMHSKEFHYYHSEGHFQMIQLDYGTTARYCATIFLPEPDQPLYDLINRMSGDDWNKWRQSALPKQEGTLYLPRIKVDYGVTSLKNVLKEMGMKSAFEDHDAFQRIGQDIFLSDVLHKAVVELDEKGTKAAAATAAIGVRACIVTSRAQPFEMKINRPFLFCISDKANGTLLFLGKIEHPQPTALRTM